jgi:hypothetical protein
LLVFVGRHEFARAGTAPMMTPEEEEFEAVAEAQVGTSREMPCMWSLVRVRTT